VEDSVVTKDIPIITLAGGEVITRGKKTDLARTITHHFGRNEGSGDGTRETKATCPGVLELNVGHGEIVLRGPGEKPHPALRLEPTGEGYLLRGGSGLSGRMNEAMQEKKARNTRARALNALGSGVCHAIKGGGQVGKDRGKGMKVGSALGKG
jgi:hypothetical protein